MFKLSSLCFLFALACVCNYAFAQNECGYDIATSAGELTEKNFKCLKLYCIFNFRFVVLQLLDYFGHLNPHFSNNYLTAQSYGIQTIDAYVTVNDMLSPTEISNNITNNLPSGFNGSVWLYVQPAGWISTNTTANFDFVQDIAQNLEESGINVGIESSVSNWTLVTGSRNTSSSYLEALPLWYIDDDNAKDFSDWSEGKFGGWNAPTMKQYSWNFYFLGCSLTGTGIGSDVR